MSARHVCDSNRNEQLSCDLVNAFHVSFKKGGRRYDIVGYKRSMDVLLKRTTKQFDNLGGFNSNYLFNVGDEGSLVTSLNKGKCQTYRLRVRYHTSELFWLIKI